MRKFFKNYISVLQKGSLKKGMKRGIRGTIIMLFLVVIVGILSIHTYATEIDKAKEEKKSLEQKKAETENKLKELEKDKSDILKYIEKLDKELNSLATEIEELETDIKNTEEELNVARKDLELAKITEASQYDIMKKRIKYMYENGESSYLDIILQSDSLSDVLNHVEYISKITEYDNSLLDKYTKIKEEITLKEISIESKLATLNNLKEELDYEQKTVSFLAEEKNKELVKYDTSIQETMIVSSDVTSKISEQEDLIEQLIEQQRKADEERKRKEEEERKRKEEERKRKEEEAKRLEEEKNNSSGGNSSGNNSSGNNSTSDNNSSSNNTNTSSSGFIWPLPSSGRITSTFGGRDRPTAGASSNHKGLDIGAPTGSAIVAAASGRVVTSTYQVAAGNYIMLAHDDGTYTVYMHCSKLLVSVGDYVNQGDKIALVGSTGVSTGPHLHFGVMVNGVYVDPQKYVSY
jgi:murein DD-endopeptidase MepM/ murein hydrolase activator NlpD